MLVRAYEIFIYVDHITIIFLCINPQHVCMIGSVCKLSYTSSLQKDVDALASQRVEEIAHELRKSESVNTSLTTELQNATGALNTTKKEVTSLKAKLQELESHLTKVDANKGSELKLQVCTA